MSLIRVAAAVLILSMPGTVLAQEWTEFASKEDLFTCNFPGTPKVTPTTWTSEYGASLPGRIYSAEGAIGRYSMTVIDYRDVEKILTEKSKSCPPGAETCRGGGGATGAGYWKIDLQGALDYATWKFIQRDAKITNFMWNMMDLVGGRQLQLTNADKSRTFVSIYMHMNKLYIMEGTVGANMPEPGLFQQSLGWLDEQGNSIRYQQFYLHGAPRPPYNSRGAPAAR
jgi:hypothetical protein